MRKKYSYIAIILIVFLFSACQKKEAKFNSTTKTSNSTESTNSIPDEIKSLLTLGKYSDNVEFFQSVGYSLYHIVLFLKILHFCL